MWKEFKEFAIKGNVIDLAVAFILGAAFTAIVTSLVNDIFMPFLGILIGIFGVSQSTDPGTSNLQIMAWLFVTGLGMGATMMPLFTSALKTLKAHEVARGAEYALTPGSIVCC